MIDTVQKIQTPEGVELNLSPASPVVRAFSWIIDFFIRVIVDVAVGLVLGVIFQDYGTGLILIFLFFNEWFYPVYFEVKKNGQTPGKKSMGLRVLNDDGTPVSWGGSILRNLISCIDFYPFMYGLGLCTMLINKRFKRLGDIAAGTLVVHVVNSKSTTTSKIPKEKPERPPLSLVAEEQKAIISYAERVSTQSMSRNIELANILSDLTEAENKEAVMKIVGYANALVGQK